VAVAQTDEIPALADPQITQATDDLAINNPGSIAEQLRRDWERKDYLFQIPGAARVLGPWYNLRKTLDEKYGFKPQFSFTNVTQWANDTLPGATEDHASGMELIIDGTWTFRGRGTDSPSMMGFEFLYRDKMGTDIPPVALFTQTGALYPTTVAFGELGPVIGPLWLQKKFNDRFGFQVGKLFPVSAYDFFPLKNFRTDFLDPIHAANVAIPLPERGLGGFVMYRPRPDVYFRIGAHDANADAEKAGFDSLFDEGELFTIFEAGFDPGIMERQPGRPPFGDVHVSLWHQDKRDEANVGDGWGFVVSGSQRFGRLLPFLRYGYSEGGSKGPALLKHMVNGGVAFDNIFGQSDDRIGIGFTWSEPANGMLSDQKAIDMFYRIQVTPEIAVSPTLQIIIDPVRNPNEDTIIVGGVRTRFTF
jgi:porin